MQKWRLSERQRPRVFMMLMSLLMVCIMSAVNLVATGNTSLFFWRWLMRVAIMWPIVAVLILLLAPAVRYVIAKLFEFSSEKT